MRVHRAVVAALLFVAAPAAAGPKERPLPGFTGLTYRDVDVPDGCVPRIRVIHRSRKGDDPELVRLLTWPRLVGLDFPPEDPARQQASMKRFSAWLRRLTDQGKKVTDRQIAIMRDTTRAPAERVAAVARLALAQEQVTNLIGGLDIPPAVRKVEDAASAYCDALQTQVEPLRAEVDEIRGACRRLIVDTQVAAGWWTDVCQPPAGGGVPTGPDRAPAPRPSP